jgi:hypothetical protein
MGRENLAMLCRFVYQPPVLPKIDLVSAFHQHFPEIAPNALTENRKTIVLMILSSLWI